MQRHVVALVYAIAASRNRHSLCPRSGVSELCHTVCVTCAPSSDLWHKTYKHALTGARCSHTLPSSVSTIFSLLEDASVVVVNDIHGSCDRVLHSQYTSRSTLVLLPGSIKLERAVLLVP